jgi:putative methionine-R-sulfoxide reductase with GAF domain
MTAAARLASTAALAPESVAWAEDVVESLRTDFLFQHVAIFLATDGDLLLAAQRWGAGADLGAVIPGEWQVPHVGSVVGRVFATGSAALIPDIRLDPDYRGFPGAVSRSELAVPIRAAQGIVGVVNLESPRVGGYGISDLDVIVERLDMATATFPGPALTA